MIRAKKHRAYNHEECGLSKPEEALDILHRRYSQSPLGQLEAEVGNMADYVMETHYNPLVYGE